MSHTFKELSPYYSGSLGPNGPWRTKDGDFDLICIAAYWSAKHVAEAIRRGADLEMCDLQGSTALFHAVSEENMDVLIKAGANLEAMNNKGRTALIYGLYSVYPPNTRQLLEAGAKPCSIHHTFDYGLHESLKLLLKYGADPDERNEDGDTYLHRSIKASRPSSVKVMIAGGANLELQDRQGRTPLQLIMSNHVMDMGYKIAKILIKSGAKYDRHAIIQRFPRLENIVKRREAQDEARRNALQSIQDRDVVTLILEY